MAVPEHSTSYEVEWGGFLTNHLAHGQWAMAFLDTPAALQQRYSGLYRTRLTPLLSVSSNDGPATATEVAALRGARRCYAEQRAFFAEQIAKVGVIDTLLLYLPQLLPGLAGAALHPIIHLAIGLRTGSDELVAEGLAYLNHSYLPAAGGAVAAVAVLAASDAEHYVEAALAQPPAPAVAASGRFQRAMAGLLGDASTVRVLRGTSSRLEFTAETMLDKAVRLYVGDGRNDYFLLHVVTASWALGVVLGAVPDLPDQTRRESVEGLATAATAAAWIQNTDLRIIFSQQKVSDPAAALAAVRAQITTLQGELEPRNEHVYKLVAIVVERLKLSTDDGTDGTPSTTAADLRDAVSLAVSSDFSGRGIGEKPTAKVDLGGAPASMHQLVA